MARMIVLILALMAVPGCGGGSGDAEPVERTTSVTEQQALDIARQTVREREGWTDVELAAEPTGNGWRITATLNPDEARIIVLGPEGDVALYSGG